MRAITNFLQSALTLKVWKSVEESCSRFFSWCCRGWLLWFKLAYKLRITQSCKTNSPNHPSALQHPSDESSFIANEASLSATAGPFKSNPLSCTPMLSLLLTGPKLESTFRRIVMDFSFSLEHSKILAFWPTLILAKLASYVYLVSMPSSLSYRLSVQDHCCFKRFYTFYTSTSDRLSDHFLVYSWKDLIFTTPSSFLVLGRLPWHISGQPIVSRFYLKNELFLYKLHR